MWPFDEIEEAVSDVADVVVENFSDIGGAAVGLITSIPVVGDVAEMAAPFAGMAGTMLGGPVGGMVGGAVGNMFGGGDSPFDFMDTALAAIGGSGFGGLASALVGGDFGSVASTFLGGDIGGVASSILGGGDFGSIAETVMGIAGAGGGGLFGSVQEAVGGMIGGDAGALLTELGEFNPAGIFGAVPGGSLLDGWQSVADTLGGQLGDVSGAMLGSLLGNAAPDFGVGELLSNPTFAGLAGLGNQVFGASGGSFGAAELGSFGPALQGLGVNVGALPGNDDLVSNQMGAPDVVPNLATNMADDTLGAAGVDAMVQTAPGDGSTDGESSDVVPSSVGGLGDDGGPALGTPDPMVAEGSPMPDVDPMSDAATPAEPASDFTETIESADAIEDSFGDEYFGPTE